VLRDDFGPESDVDLLADYSPEARLSIADLDDMEAELREIMGLEVDLLSKSEIERSRNPYRRREILGSGRVIYPA